ncbi:probable serine/threonine-protein kinase clkA [Zerene cesonia]|uniref:probable serine/threonine-protein kinase clkA n=1 Tax=Zerene cesonia TaxID=33412 RepID=UPI0018E53C90|nr:probable serine/threonine-protein kinase clkA [Zerene cesonia]
MQPTAPQNCYQRPSFASEALSRLTEALTSIALYDDYQCVPRLLCEAGGGALGATSALPTGLQPLLTLLSAYGGISSNPLFVFGRAVLLGVSSKENPSICRHAYPQCPSDPEQLVHYLNNHNGGFFRFFNSPQQGQQDVQQFYNHLQNYQINQQNVQQVYNDNGQHNQNYGIYQQQSHGGIQENNINPGYGFQKPNTYPNYGNKYGYAYPYDDRFKNDLKIQKRIQNKPHDIENDGFSSNNNLKWSFPEKDVFEASEDVYNNVKDTRQKDTSKTLKFPETNINNIRENNRKTRGFVFPYNLNYYTNYYDQVTDDNSVNDNKVSTYNSNNYNYNKVNDGYITVYVVRGNGDPNRPEIIKLRPGESL